MKNPFFPFSTSVFLPRAAIETGAAVIKRTQPKQCITLTHTACMPGTEEKEEEAAFNAK